MGGDITVLHIVHDHENAPSLRGRQLGNGLIQTPIFLLTNDLVRKRVRRGIEQFILYILIGNKAAVIVFLLVLTILFTVESTELLIQFVGDRYFLVNAVIVLDLDGFPIVSSKSFKVVKCSERLGGWAASPADRSLH